MLKEEGRQKYRMSMTRLMKNKLLAI